MFGMNWLPHCAFPLARSRFAGPLSRYAGYSIFWMYGLPACQKFGLAVYWMLFGVHGLTMNGPVPTGFGSAHVSGCAAASPVEKMCCGTMPTWSAKLKKYDEAGLANVIVTWLPLAVTLWRPAPVHSAYRSVAGTCFIRLNVNATSSALNAWPSFH